MQRLKAEIAARVRSEVTVNSRIPEIEHLVLRYCLQEYPHRVRLPKNSTDLCVDDCGSLLVRGTSIFVLSQDGQVLRKTTVFDDVQWIVYHPGFKKLLMARSDLPRLRVDVLDPTTWRVKDWRHAPHSTTRPIVDNRSAHLVVLDRSMSCFSTARLLDTDGNEVGRRESQGWFMHGLELGNGRVALLQPPNSVLVIGPEERLGRSIPMNYCRGRCCCYDPVSCEIITLVDQELHFLHTTTWALRSAAVDIGDPTWQSAEMLLRTNSDGTRILYIRNDDSLFVFDLATFDP